MARRQAVRLAVPACLIVTVALLARPDGVRALVQAPVARVDLPLDGSTYGVTRQIARDESHRYRVTLTAGEYVAVDVTQLGADVAIETRGPGGNLIATVQDAVTRQGIEHVELAADATGEYSLDVSLAPGIVTPGAYSIRLASRRSAKDADRAIQESRILRTSAARLDADGKLDDARPLFERALAIAERTRGHDDPYTVARVCDAAENALERRDNAVALALYGRALTALTKSPGPSAPQTAFVQTRLALIYQRTGDRGRAESTLQPALDVLQRTVGADHLWYVRSLITLSNLRNDGGDLDKSEQILERALAILDRLEPADSLLHGTILNNLGDVARQRNDLDRANGFLQRALAIAEARRGPESFYVTTTLQDLAIVARERKDYKSAERYNLRALEIRERLEGPNHPDVAQILINLANVYRNEGDNAAGLDMQFRALHIWETSGGPYERGTLLTVGNIARTYASIGDFDDALVYQRRTDELVERQLALSLSIGSEREKLAFAQAIAERTERTISLHLDRMPARPDAAALAALVLLQRKGRVLDSMADAFAAVRQRGDARSRALVDQWNGVTSRLAAIALKPDPAHAGEHSQAITDLESERERVEAELSREHGEVRASVQPVTLDAVEAAIPVDAALIEFAVFRPFDPSADRNAEAYGAPHYAAYVLRHDAAPVGIDLGPAAALDAQIDALRQALRDPNRTDVTERARAVDARVIAPLRPMLGDASRLLISPDGELNLVPFEAFMDADGKYLIERYAVTYLTSGRDLLRMNVEGESKSPPVIVADPYFGEPRTVATPAPSAGRGVAASNRSSASYFAPLAGTAEEARTIKGLFPDAVLLTRRQATKAALQQLDAPRVLHIASHGFFLQDAGRDATENPLLRSGLALAGANLPHSTRDPGILTASEASGLNLWGTKLVTLSACDTGLGEVRNGEGVYGLRRAFVLAGAETLVMSLWAVSDYVTRETMTAYYQGLRRGEGRGDALRQAKLAILHRRGREHPFYWASFIASGEWTPLGAPR